mgnify:CR=1 FL=1|tara:strand:+ start:1271 stop:1891 length:621 start_codon:yes stop_codon:yes gene_type:complete
MSALEMVKYINPMSIMDSCASWTGFNFVHNYLNLKMERNLANNFTALFHACGSSLFALSYLISGDKNTYYFLKKFSTGYFLYDTYHTAKYLKQPLSSMYIYHHFATTYYIHQNPEIYKAGQIMFWAELSNIPSYFVYYYLKKSKDTKKIKLLKSLQFYIYAFIRLPILSYYSYDVLKNAENKTPAFIALPVYFMGLIWSYNLWKNL